MVELIGLKIEISKQPTVWEVVPPMLKYFVNSTDVKPEDFQSVRSIFSGAAPLGETLEKNFALKFPLVKLIQGYGLSESSAPNMACSLLNTKHSKSGKTIF